MGKSVHIPENLSKTQYVEEMFRNIKDAPENKKNKAMQDQVRHLRDEKEDVHTLEKGQEADEQHEEEDSMYRDDVVEISTENDEEEIDEEESLERGVELYDDEEDDEDRDPRGQFLDIEG